MCALKVSNIYAESQRYGDCIDANSHIISKSSEQSFSTTPLTMIRDNDLLAAPGYVVTIDLNLRPENGFVPEPLFDTSGVVRFVLGWGNYLPGLHSLCEGMKIGEEVSGVSIDAGWGERDDDLLIELPMDKVRPHFKNGDVEVGATLKLQGGKLLLAVTEVHEDTVVVDANPPLAGASYACDLKILNIEPLDDLLQESKTAITTKFERYDDAVTTSAMDRKSRYQVSTWALGCFWGGELAFMRVQGVVGTRVGYTQGVTVNPTYEAVCTGKTQHRESIMVVYDPEVVSYQELMEIALERLKITYSPANNASSMIYRMFEEPEEYAEELPSSENLQYKTGFYHHSQEQHEMATHELDSISNPYSVEVKAASIFYKAEEYHQQYLLKGGQSARKGSKETILCYG